MTPRTRQRDSRVSTPLDPETVVARAPARACALPPAERHL